MKIDSNQRRLPSGNQAIESAAEPGLWPVYVIGVPEQIRDKIEAMAKAA